MTIASPSLPTAARSPDANVPVDGFRTTIPRLPENIANVVDRERADFKTRDQVALVAKPFRGDGRRAEAEDIAAGPSADPERAVGRRQKASHGCDWLTGRRASLAGEIAWGGAWTEAQAAPAHDRLGTPLDFPAGEPTPTRRTGLWRCAT